MKIVNLIFCILLSLFIKSVGAEEKSISGYVTQEGNRIYDAKIIVNSSSSSSFEAITYSDSNGHFSLYDVPAGQVSLLVFNQAEQFVGEKKIELLENQIINNLRLQF